MKIRDTERRYTDFLQPQHRLLLRASLLGKDSAVAAFESWHENADWAGNFDADTFQLLPQLYANLDRCGYDAPIMGRLRGIYRNTWYRNQQLLALLQNLIKRLELSDIPTMLLGDAALMYGYCISPGARNLGTLDILIPAEHASAASKIMMSECWQIAADSTGDLQYRQHACFTRGNNHTCTLYWYTPPKTGLSHSMSWERARPARLNGIDTLIPDAPELLLHHVRHGLTLHGSPTLPGLVALSILAGAEGMDWSVATRLAGDNYMELKLFMSLTTLKAALETTIPDEVLSELGEKKVSLVETLELRAARRRPDAKDNFLGPLERLSHEFLQYTGKSAPAVMIAEFPAFLRYHYGTESLIRIFGHVAINSVRRTGRVIGRLFNRDKNRLAT